MSLILDGTNGLSDVDGTAGTPAIRGSDANTGVFFGTDIVGVSTGGSERVRVDASGNVGIGTSSPTLGLSVQKDNGSGYVASFRKSASDPALTIQTTGGVTQIQGLNSTFTDVSNIAMQVSGGNLLVGTTSSWGGSPKMEVRQTTNSAWGLSAYNAGTTTGGALLLRVDNTSLYLAGFYYTGAVLTGTITTNGTNTTYGTSSDYRLKENIAPMTGALAKVAALKPVTYTWKATGETDEGFIAHELQEVCPSAVTGEKDAVNEDGSIKPQGIDTSFLVATLTAAIQEQQALIESLTARVVALEQA